MRGLRKKALIAVGLLLAAPIVLLLIVIGAPALSALMGGGYQWHDRYSQVDPSGATRLLIESRYTVPAMEMVDPAIKARFSTIDIATGKVHHSMTREFEEDSDLKEPQTQWRAEQVVLANFNQRDPAERLALPTKLKSESGPGE